MPLAPRALPSLGRRLATVITVAVTGALALTTASTAQAAGTYIHLGCDSAASSVADGYGGWHAFATISQEGIAADNRCGYGGLHAQIDSPSDMPLYTAAGWTYDAPPNTYISAVNFNWGGWTRAYDNVNRGLIDVSGNASGIITQSSGETVWPTLRPGGRDSMHDTSVTAKVSCNGPTGHPGCAAGQSNGWMSLFSPRVFLGDDTPPDAGGVSGSATSNTTWKGGETLAYAATDAGSGIARFRLYVDGSPAVDHVVDTFNGHCSIVTSEGGLWVFAYPKPCPGAVDTAETVDTTALSDGPHTVTAKVVDASQREATLFTGSKLVANHPPVNTAAPSFADASKASQPHVGDALTADNGAWSGPSLTFARAWQQCDSSGSACVQIPGATSPTYLPSAGDTGHRLRFAVTATNAADSVTAYSGQTGVVQAQPSSVDAVVPKPPPAATDASAGGGGNAGGANDVTVPGLRTTTTNELEHIFIGHVVGERVGVACPHDRATLVFQHVVGGRVRLSYGHVSAAQLLLTCTLTGKAIAGAKLEIATKTGAQPAVASDVTTDGAGHATLRLGKGASRGISVGYRMYADDPMARATATLKLLVASRVAIKADGNRLRNGQAVTLSGRLAGGLVPRRGVAMTVQWKDGKRWRPFAQIKTDRRGTFRYAYKFTRTRRLVTYRLRVQVSRGQIDYPFEPMASRALRVTVAS